MPKASSKKKEEVTQQPAAVASTQSSGGIEQQKLIPPLSYIDGQLAGVQLHDGSVVALADLPEVELRKLATDMEIDGAETLAVDLLVGAIQAEPALVPAGVASVDSDNNSMPTSGADVAVTAPVSIHGRATGPDEHDHFLVLMSDGSPAHLEELSASDLTSLTLACLRLAPVGLAGAQFIGLDLAKGGDATAVSIFDRGGSGFRYVVCRERLDHDDKSYSRGEIIQFQDDEQAHQLLLIGAIAPEVE